MADRRANWLALLSSRVAGASIAGSRLVSHTMSTAAGQDAAWLKRSMAGLVAPKPARRSRCAASVRGMDTLVPQGERWGGGCVRNRVSDALCGYARAVTSPN